MKTKFIRVFFFLILFSKTIFAQWETVYFPTLGAQLPLLFAVEFKDFNNGIAVGYLDGNKACILRTINNGNSWDTVYISTDTLCFRDITYSNSTTAFCVAYRAYCCNPNIGIIAKSTDSGITWTTTMTNVGLTSICFPSQNIGYTSGYSGTVMKTTNGGSTWTPLNTGFSGWLTSIFFINNNIGFACAKDTILKTTNGGLNWTIQSITPNNNFIKIHFPYDSIGYCITEGGGSLNNLYKTIDQGNTWNYISSITASLYVQSIYFTDNDTGYAAGQFCMKKTTDGGLTWTSQNALPPGWPNFYDDITDVFFLNKNTGFAVGFGQFYRIGNDTTTSTNISNNINKDIVSIFPNPANDILNISIPLSDDKHFDFKIYNNLGRLVSTNSIQNTVNFTYDVSNLTEGIYYIQLTSDNQTPYKRKIIISR